MAVRSAGLLMFRRIGGEVEVFLGHPGGPIWAKKDLGAWTLPKGEIEPGEEPFTAAIREFGEETSLPSNEPFIELGTIRQKAGKIIHAWAFESDADPRDAVSNMFQMQWPPRSGRKIDVHELDQFRWFSISTARLKMNPAQADFLDRLLAALG